MKLSIDITMYTEVKCMTYYELPLRIHYGLCAK